MYLHVLVIRQILSVQDIENVGKVMKRCNNQPK